MHEIKEKIHDHFPSTVTSIEVQGESALDWESADLRPEAPALLHMNSVNLVKLSTSLVLILTSENGDNSAYLTFPGLGEEVEEDEAWLTKINQPLKMHS